MAKENTALITGATSGIGYELAEIFSKHDYNLILVARNNEKLRELSKTLKRRDEQKVHIITEDLSKLGAAEKVIEKVQRLGLDVDILINNAGLGYVGSFHEKSLEEDFQIMQLNMGCLTELTKFITHEMIRQKNGRILNVASTGSYHPGPYTAVYYATKAYVLSFTEALSIELKPYGIQVSALCPGATRTQFAKRAGKTDPRGAMDAKRVAEAAFEGLMKNKKVIIPGVWNKLFVKMPKSWAAPMIGKYQKALRNNTK